VTEAIGQSEEEEARDGDHALLTLARVVRDVSQRPIPTLQAATTVPESERTAIPAAGKTVNGTEVTVESVESVESAVSEESAQTVETVAETVEIAADAILMTDLDETYSTNDPDVAAAMTAGTVVNKIVVVTDGVEVVEVAEVAVLGATVVHGAALHHLAGKSLPQT
jgi:hypothetical protein